MASKHEAKEGIKMGASKHTKTLFAAIAAVAMMLAFSWAVADDNCQLVNARTSSDFELFEPPNFDLCAIFQVSGTLKGPFTSCLNFADVLPSDEIWGDDNFRYFAIKWFEVFDTKDGEIYGDDRGIVDFDTGVQATIFEVTGGTGAYEDATGVLTFVPKWPRLDIFKIQGEICGPNIPPDDDDDDSDEDSDD